ncbi:hydroxymethylbilane synthase [bacterium]|nr:hydroxymethylbilane synthase [bacterium]
MILRFGTRGSKLALWQTRFVMEKIRAAFPDIQLSEVIVKTLGDNVTNVPLFRVGGQGIFIKEIEDSLSRNQIDIAVHSLKDMPHELGKGLALAAVSAREDPRDVLISLGGKKFSELPKNCTIGTSSLRRRTQLSALRPDLSYSDLRGNLDTRLRKLADGEVEAIVLAAAGLNRLGWQDRISDFFPVESFIPAACQGFLGIECRKEDLGKLSDVFTAIEDPNGRIAATAERSFLEKLRGGCQIAMAVHAQIEKNQIRVHAFLGSPQGDRNIGTTRSGTLNEAEAIGCKAAEDLMAQGGLKLLEEWNAKFCVNPHSFQS